MKPCFSATRWARLRCRKKARYLFAYACGAGRIFPFGRPPLTDLTNFLCLRDGFEHQLYGFFAADDSKKHKIVGKTTHNHPADVFPFLWRCVCRDFFIFSAKKEPKFFQTAGCFPVRKKFKACKKRYCAYEKTKKFNFAFRPQQSKKTTYRAYFRRATAQKNL